MRKLLLIPAACLGIMISSCGHNATDANAIKKIQADSLSRADSEKHDKLVRSLVKDTNRNNFTDAGGKRQGYWIVTNALMHLPGYDSTAKVEEGEYNDNMKEGEWIEYNSDGSVKSKTTFKDDKPIN